MKGKLFMLNFAKFSYLNNARNQNLRIESNYSEIFKPNTVNRFYLSALTETP